VKLQRFRQRLLWAVWPAFLMAGVLEIVVFALVDPQDLHWLGQPLDWSRQAVYTAAFFVFWIVTLVSNVLTSVLDMPAAEINE
jgi:MFS superfamily sulfate permease-like transporter